PWRKIERDIPSPFGREYWSTGRSEGNDSSVNRVSLRYQVVPGWWKSNWGFSPSFSGWKSVRRTMGCWFLHELDEVRDAGAQDVPVADAGPRLQADQLLAGLGREL